MSATTPNHLAQAFEECAAEIDALFARCCEAAPNYGVAREAFVASLQMGANKYLVAHQGDERASDEAASDDGAPSSAAAATVRAVSTGDVRQFISDLQSSDLFLAIACAQGNEHAWWDFDAGYRRFIERIAQHLAGAPSEAEEALELVYTELYGTRVVEGVRQSKFATYSGRGNLRGWLRAIVWHAVVDLHRARRDEVTIDDWSEGGGETADRPGWRGLSHAGEQAMTDTVARSRYGAATLAALDASFAMLDAHEKLLLLYYHVEGLKLREIARLVEEPQSPLRRWFQRQSKQRGSVAPGRVHESTVMRWLEKVYARIHRRFAEELRGQHGLGAEEIKLCIEMAGEGFAPDNLQKHLTEVIPDKVEQKSG
ncbi:MAG TPA: hypothetical protein VNA19_06300 [Pyrinomonadaceae bacterium]|nr:hypothetical protein [Pyrinomonadaceae bacterium]